MSTDDYSDIMQHPRYQLRNHHPMPENARAAQFSAFAALTGFDEEIDETARLTTARADLSEDDIAALDAAFQRLLQAESERPEITVVFFQPDTYKEGGSYAVYSGRFRHFDAAAGKLFFTDGTAIPADSLSAVLFED